MKEDLQLFNDLIDKVLKDEKENPVTAIIEPDKLYEKLDLSLQYEASIDSDFKRNLEQIILSTPKTASNLFFNQLFGGRNSKAFLGELLAVMLNNSMYTYKVAGPQIGIEKTILKNIIDLIGFGNEADGTFAPGGSMTIFMAMLMARDAYDLDIRYEGAQSKMTLYTSEESHYSVAKNAAFIGTGRNNIRFIPSNSKGQILIDKLEQQIEEDLANGFKPFYINATASTTVLGAFDDIKAMSNIAKKHKIWLHVDGAFGGSVIFSKKYKHLIDGVEYADSFSINAHKMLGTPLSTSIIIVQNKKHLYDSFSNDATYLYQTDGDDLNLGKISLQCGRRNDALKFWTLWKSVGTSGLEKIVDQHFHLADVARKYIQSNPDYTLYSFEDSLCICFNYKNYSPIDLCNQLYEKSELMVGYGQFKDNTFIRLVSINTENTATEILNFFKVLENFADKD